MKMALLPGFFTYVFRGKKIHGQSWAGFLVGRAAPIPSSPVRYVCDLREMCQQTQPLSPRYKKTCHWMRVRLMRPRVQNHFVNCEVLCRW